MIMFVNNIVLSPQAILFPLNQASRDRIQHYCSLTPPQRSHTDNGGRNIFIVLVLVSIPPIIPEQQQAA